MTIAELVVVALDILAKGGLPAVALLILVGGYRRWWVFGWVFEDEVRRGKEWRELALSGTLTAEKAVTLMDAVTQTSRLPVQRPREGTG